ATIPASMTPRIAIQARPRTARSSQGWSGSARTDASARAPRLPVAAGRAAARRRRVRRRGGGSVRGRVRVRGGAGLVAGAAGAPVRPLSGPGARRGRGDAAGRWTLRRWPGLAGGAAVAVVARAVVAPPRPAVAPARAVVAPARSVLLLPAGVIAAGVIPTS